LADLQLWRNFEKKARTSRTMNGVLKEARWFYAQLKPSITSQAGWGSWGKTNWEQQCQRCRGSKEGEIPKLGANR